MLINSILAIPASRSPGLGEAAVPCDSENCMGTGAKIVSGFTGVRALGFSNLWCFLEPLCYQGTVRCSLTGSRLSSPLVAPHAALSSQYEAKG